MYCEKIGPRQALQHIFILQVGTSGTIKEYCGDRHSKVSGHIRRPRWILEAGDTLRDTSGIFREYALQGGSGGEKSNNPNPAILCGRFSGWTLSSTQDYSCTNYIYNPKLYPPSPKTRNSYAKRNTRTTAIEPPRFPCTISLYT